jgi:hypothetical protein
MARPGILGAIALGFVVGGCGLVTGGTAGYTQAPRGDDGGLFGGDAGPACGASSDCAGGVCCLSVDYVQGMPIPVASCKADCAGGVPLCTTNADCGGAADAGSPADGGDAGDGGSAATCMRQQCDVGGLPTTLGLCGAVFKPYCAAAP